VDSWHTDHGCSHPFTQLPAGDVGTSWGRIKPRMAPFHREMERVQQPIPYATAEQTFLMVASPTSPTWVVRDLCGTV